MSFFISRAISASFWGRFSDQHGRRTALLIILTILIFMNILFGFMNFFWWALAVRFMTGMFQGLSPVSKACITEILPKEKDAQAVAIVSVLWYMGNILGPFVGGISANRIDGYPWALPGIIVGGIMAFNLLLVYLFFTETFKMKINRHPGLKRLIDKAVKLETEEAVKIRHKQMQ